MGTSRLALPKDEVQHKDDDNNELDNDHRHNVSAEADPCQPQCVGAGKMLADVCHAVSCQSQG